MTVLCMYMSLGRKGILFTVPKWPICYIVQCIHCVKRLYNSIRTENFIVFQAVFLVCTRRFAFCMLVCRLVLLGVIDISFNSNFELPGSELSIRFHDIPLGQMWLSFVLSQIFSGSENDGRLSLECWRYGFRNIDPWVSIELLLVCPDCSLQLW